MQQAESRTLRLVNQVVRNLSNVGLDTSCEFNAVHEGCDH